MLNWIRTGAILIAFLALLFPAQSFAANASEYSKTYALGKNTLQVQFVPDKTTVMLGEPIWATFRLTNVKGPIITVVDAGEPVSRLDFNIVAYGAKGTRLGKAEQTAIFDRFVRVKSLGSGQKLSTRLPLNIWCPFTHPGRYTACCLQMGFFEYDKEAEFSRDPKTVAFPLIVTPYNAAEMGRIIDNYGKQLLAPMTPNDKTARIEAAQSLSIIPDARILPWLSGELANPTTSEDADETCMILALNGIAQLATPAAVEALLPAFDKPLISDNAGYAFQQMLAKVDKSQAAALSKLMISDLEDRYETASTPAAKEAALRAMGFTRNIDALAPLAAVLDSAVPDGRCAAAEALGYIPDKAAVEPLLKSHLTDAEMALRISVVRGLLTLRVPLHYNWLIPIVKSWTPDEPGPAGDAMQLLGSYFVDSRGDAAIAYCLHFNDPDPSDLYNNNLIQALTNGQRGPTLLAPWHARSADASDPQAIADNKAGLAAIQKWLAANHGYDDAADTN